LASSIEIIRMSGFPLDGQQATRAVNISFPPKAAVAFGQSSNSTSSA
jgi:hypothetical protein